MGLLTDPSGLNSFPSQLVVKKEKLIAFLLYGLGILWFILLASHRLNAATYLSENALLPGLVTVGCEVGNDARILLEELEREMETHTDGPPTAWLRAKLRRMGLQAHRHNFTLHYPLGKGATFRGVNVYGIIHGGGASTESIVLSAPYRGKNSVHPSTAPGIALLLAMGSCFRKQKYWAKDIILLITDHEQLGVQAWLEAYHGTTCGDPGVLDSGDLPVRGGGIQAALNLELPSHTLHALNVKLLGLNGQLPNLDLPNLVHRICSKEKVRHTFGSLDRTQFKDEFMYNLGVLTQMVLSQASGVPDGNHGLFHRFGIEAVTLEGVVLNKGGIVGLNQVGRVLEGVFRSVNNLLERFHQSYFFYLLADTDRFVSIGLYMVSLGLQVGALFIRAFSSFLKIKARTTYQMKTGEEGPPLGARRAGFLILATYSIGLAIHVAPGLSSFSSFFPGKTENVVLCILSVSSVVILCLPWVIPSGDSALLLIPGTLGLGTLLLAVAMHNFSLAFLAGLFVIPMALLPKRIFVIIAHPLLLAALAVLVGAVGRFSPDELLDKVIQGLSQAIVLSVVDKIIYGSWTWTVVTLFYLPNWIIFWIVANSKESVIDQPLPKPKKE